MALAIVFGVLMVAFFGFEIFLTVRDIKKRKVDKKKELQESEEEREEN